jgi:hypothetical protein
MNLYNYKKMLELYELLLNLDKNLYVSSFDLAEQLYLIFWMDLLITKVLKYALKIQNRKKKLSQISIITNKWSYSTSFYSTLMKICM